MSAATTVVTSTPAASGVVGRGWRQLRRFFRASPLNVVAVLVVLIAIVVATLGEIAEVTGSQITPFDPIKPNLLKRLKPPSAEHWFGTDQLGRDIFSRVLIGARISVQTAVAVLFSAALLGILAGITAGWFGGLVDEILMRIADLFLAFPALILAAAISTSLGGNLLTTTIALAAVFWPWYARVARSRVLTLRTQQFVTASVALGASQSRLIFKTFLPLIWPTMIVQATTDVGFVMLSTAGLSFLGLGAQPPTPEWGSMIFTSLSFQPTSWWLAVFPGAGLAFVALGFNLLGDGLRDFLDPS